MEFLGHRNPLVARYKLAAADAADAAFPGAAAGIGSAVLAAAHLEVADFAVACRQATALHQ